MIISLSSFRNLENIFGSLIASVDTRPPSPPPTSTPLTKGDDDDFLSIMKLVIDFCGFDFLVASRGGGEDNIFFIASWCFS